MRVKRISRIMVGVFIAASLLVFGSRQIFIISTNHYVDTILSNIDIEDREGIALNVARWAASEFAVDAGRNDIFQYALILYNERLPNWARLPRGSVDVWIFRGLCSELSRALEFIYERGGLTAMQHDIVAPSAGHSAVSVFVDGQWIFVDPFFGVAFHDGKKFLSLHEAQEITKGDSDVGDIIYPISQNVNYEFYENIANFSHGMRHEIVTVDVKVPYSSEPVAFGRLDGNWGDVQEEASSAGMTTHLYYVGPKYNRNFVFKLTPSEPVAGFTITFEMIEPVDPQHVPKTNGTTTVEENKLIISISENSGYIILSYEAMGWSLGRLLKRRSWYLVDRITVSFVDSKI